MNRLSEQQSKWYMLQSSSSRCACITVMWVQSAPIANDQHESQTHAYTQYSQHNHSTPPHNCKSPIKTYTTHIWRQTASILRVDYDCSVCCWWFSHSAVHRRNLRSSRIEWINCNQLTVNGASAALRRWWWTGMGAYWCGDDAPSWSVAMYMLTRWCFRYGKERK